MNWKSECIQKRVCRNIPLRDSCCKSQCNVYNPAGLQVIVVKIDDCEVHEGLRCDYLLHIPCQGLVNFVELKGVDLEHGISQVGETLRLYHSRLNGCNIICYVICSHFPKAITKKQILIKKFKKRYGELLRIERTPHVIELPN